MLRSYVQDKNTTGKLDADGKLALRDLLEFEKRFLNKGHDPNIGTFGYPVLGIDPRTDQVMAEANEINLSERTESWKFPDDCEEAEWPGEPGEIRGYTERCVELLQRGIQENYPRIMYPLGKK
eukprot:11563817-Heterocapsa_arctica.AAC.1